MKNKNPKRKVLWVIMMVAVLSTLVIGFDGGDYTSKIDKSVVDTLNEQDEVEVIVILKEKNNKDLQSLTSSSLENNGFNKQIKSIGGGWISGRITRDQLQTLNENQDILRVYVPEMASIQLSESIDLIDVNDTWDGGFNGSGTSICVIDTGVDYEHVDFGGRVIAQKCYCNYPDVGQQYCCPDGTNEDENASDNNGHGTHVAGIIASANANYRGVAYDSNIVAVKVCNSTGKCYPGDIANGIDWCQQNKEAYNISVISISLGGGFYDNSSICDVTSEGLAVNRADNASIVVVAASGNNGNFTHISNPGCASKAISVGSVYDDDVGLQSWCLDSYCIRMCADFPTDTDLISCFTNRGKLLDFLAPGSVITSLKYNGGIMNDSGTSMATPHVSGAMALIKQVNQNLTLDEIKLIINRSGMPIYDNDTNTTFVRINVDNATKYAMYSEFVTVSNTGASDLNVSMINGTSSWISDIYPSSFVLKPEMNQTLMVTVDLDDNLDIGSYSADLIIHSNDPDESSVSIDIKYQKIHIGCTGICPPQTGDWIINNYTAIWYNDTVVDGDININSTTLFLGEQETNLSGNNIILNGELKLDNGVIRFD